MGVDGDNTKPPECEEAETRWLTYGSGLDVFLFWYLRLLTFICFQLQSLVGL